MNNGCRSLWALSDDAGAARVLSQARRVKLEARLALPIFTGARAMPMVRTNNAMRCFCAAKCGLDARADPGARGVGPGLLLGEFAARWPAELDAFAQTATFQTSRLRLVR